MGDRILEGITVIDTSTFVTGGFATLMLANQGAEVIKVERPELGDDIRHSGPPFIDGESPYYWTVNYGKRSIELDLTTEEGVATLYDLVEGADVFVQNFRPSTAERLGVDADSLRDLNPALIYCGISAFGNSGPWRDRAGYDLLLQGYSGIQSVTGPEDGDPTKVGLPQTDLITGMWAAFGIVTALYRRANTGTGETIDLGMLDAVLPWLTKQAGRVFAGEQPERMGNRDPVLAPYQTYATADGRINVACLNNRLWERFCTAIDRPSLAEDDRFETNADRVEHMDALERLVEEALAERSTEEWLALFRDEGVPAGPVADVSDALYNEQTDARETLTELSDGDRTIPTIEHPLRYDASESGFQRPPPKLGADTRAVLRERGYSDEEIDDLATAGAFGENH